MIRRPPRSTLDRSSAASDVYKRQEDKGKHAYLMKIETGDEFGFEYLSEYTLKDGLYTGEYKIRSFEMSWDDTPAEYNEVARGTFSAFGLKNVGKELYPVGTIT